VQYLTSEDVVAFYREAIGEPDLRYPDGLESAIGRPQQSAFGEAAYPTLPLKTAALMQSLAENQSFVDGNKRIAWICAKVFLQINGATMHATEAEGYDLLVNGIASGDRQHASSYWHIEFTPYFCEVSRRWRCIEADAFGDGGLLRKT